MKVSTRTRYGLRAMIYMAGKDRPTRGETVAGHEDISKKYLDAILKQLREAGFLKSVRGPGGGYMLSRPLGEIRVADVVRALEGGLAVIFCVEKTDACEKAETCSARRVWISLSEAVENTLSGITLADLAHGRPGLPGAHTPRKGQKAGSRMPEEKKETDH